MALTISQFLENPQYRQFIKPSEAIATVKGFLVDTSQSCIGIINPKKLETIKNAPEELQTAIEKQLKAPTTIRSPMDIAKQMFLLREFKQWEKNSKATLGNEYVTSLEELVHSKRKLIRQTKVVQDEQSLSVFLSLFTGIITGLFVLENTQSYYYKQPNVLPALIFGAFAGGVAAALGDRIVKRNDEKTQNLAERILKKSIELYNKISPAVKIDEQNNELPILLTGTQPAEKVPLQRDKQEAVKSAKDDSSLLIDALSSSNSPSVSSMAQGVPAA